FARAKALTGCARPRAIDHAKSESRCDFIDGIRPNRPPDRSAGGRGAFGHPAPARAFGGDGFVHHADELEVARAQRHDAIRRAPGGMSATLDRGEAEALVERLGGRLEVR